MEIIYVLVEPSVAENIGAAARAIKTMGFSRLRLVNPNGHLTGPAKWMAHGSNDILENAGIFSTFNEAVNDVDLVVGTTAKKRIVKNDYLPASALPEIIRQKGSAVKAVAVVFGREDSGLRNEELKRCDIITTIPLKTSFPSLNLSQAVMIYAYVLSGLISEPNEDVNIRDTEGLKILKQKVSDILLSLGFSETSAIYPRILERLMFMKEGDIHLLHSICNKFIAEKKSVTDATQ